MKAVLYACIEKNIGDDLFIYTICKRYPHIDFFISDNAKYLSVNKIENLHYSKELSLFIRCSNYTDSFWLKRFVKRIILIYSKILMKKFDFGVYIVGNAFKNMNYKGDCQIYWLKERIKLIKDFYLISTNFGPYNNIQWVDDCRKVFSEITDICFRDLESYNLFENMNNTRVAPDAVLSLDIRSRENGATKSLLISVIDCGFKSRDKWLNDLQEEYELKIKEIIQFFSKKGYKITLLNSNTEQDVEASIRIKAGFEDDTISVVNYDGCIEKIMDLYKMSSCVIATRLHTIILAWKFNVPVFPIIYDLKVQNVLKSYNYKGASIDIRNIINLKPEDVELSFKTNSSQIDNDIITEANKQFALLDKRINDGTKK